MKFYYDYVESLLKELKEIKDNYRASSTDKDKETILLWVEKFIPNEEEALSCILKNTFEECDSWIEERKKLINEWNRYIITLIHKTLNSSRTDNNILISLLSHINKTINESYKFIEDKRKDGRAQRKKIA